MTNSQILIQSITHSLDSKVKELFGLNNLEFGLASVQANILTATNPLGKFVYLTRDSLYSKEIKSPVTYAGIRVIHGSGKINISDNSGKTELKQYRELPFTYGTSPIEGKNLFKLEAKDCFEIKADETSLILIQEF